MAVTNRTGRPASGTGAAGGRAALRAPRRALLERALDAAAQVASGTFRKEGGVEAPLGRPAAPRPARRGGAEPVEGPAAPSVAAWAVDVAWVRDREMRRLNRRFAGREGSTDVLAFPYDPATPRGGATAGPQAEGPELLGEIVVNLELAARLAREHGNSREAEAVLYATHGLVHLLGGKDETPRDRRAMREVEVAALAAAGLEVRGGEWG